MATYAGRYDEALIRRVGDRPAFPASGTTVLVKQSDGSTTATLYTDRTKATTATNPVEPDASGNLEFFAEPGTYVLSIREDGTEVATDTVTVLNDPEESTGGGGGATNLSWDAATSTVASDTGTDATLTVVDASNPGLMTVADKSKLDGIEANATADQTAAEILTALLTVDGDTSGLDADLLDGQHGSHYATAASVSDHLADTIDAHDASAISYVGGTGMSATDVEAAIDELATEKAAAADLTAHLNDTADAHDASAISIVDSGAYFTSTDVEGALQELGASSGGGGGGTGSGCRVTQSSGTSLPAATTTALSFDTEAFDDASYHESVTNPSRLTAPSDGLYVVGASAGDTAAQSDGGSYFLQLRLNGVTTLPAIQRVRPRGAGTPSPGLNVSTTVRLTAGDYLQAMHQVPAASTSDTAITEFWIVRIGD